MHMERKLRVKATLCSLLHTAVVSGVRVSHSPPPKYLGSLQLTRHSTFVLGCHGSASPV